MEANWVTVVVLLFGIMVALYGVYAYLRMFAKHKDGPDAETPPPIHRAAPASEDTHTVTEKQPDRKGRGN
ncbi:hypothetical protein ACFSL6_12695 [Paenibacillus thailandensis]|jgi:hypothetical protein|uniref:Uncharacterized protein n=1 Tax=Paenibacillus thailandensis TaxID=393250 RepID=A0ABW5R1E7_9BACL